MSCVEDQPIKIKPPQTGDDISGKLASYLSRYDPLDRSHSIEAYDGDGNPLNPEEFYDEVVLTHPEGGMSYSKPADEEAVFRHFEELAALFSGEQ